MEIQEQNKKSSLSKHGPISEGYQGWCELIHQHNIDEKD